MSLDRLEDADELLDADGHDEETLAASLRQVAAVNRWLGGRRALLCDLEALLGDGPVRLLDIGTGSGDEPRAIAGWAARTGRSVEILAVDRHSQVLGVARRRTAAFSTIRVAGADALRLPFRDRAFDVALLSLTLHHFAPDQQIEVLREMDRVSRLGIIVSDLERCWPNYLGAVLLAHTVWRGNPLTRHDGPISVRRALSRPELEDIARRAGLHHVHVQRRFFYRLVLTARPDSAAASRTV